MIKIKEMSPLFKNNLSKQTNIFNSQINLNSTSNSKDKILKLYLKGLIIYIKNITSYNSKWNNKKLITNIKNNLESQLIENNIKENLTNKEIITIEENKYKLNSKTLNQEFFNYIDLIIKEKENKTLNSSSITTNKDKEEISKYIKSITIFNSKPKGQIFTFTQQINYNFNINENKLIKKIYSFLFYSFFSMNSLISKPILDITPNKVIIHLFFYHFHTFYSKSVNKNNYKFNENKDNISIKNYTFLMRNHKKLNIICNILSRYLKKPVELELVKLNYPYLDSNIFVNFLALMVNKKKIRNIMKRYFKFAAIKNTKKLYDKRFLTKIPSFLSGISIKIAGRLLTNRIIPRKTVKIISRGAIARGKVNFLDIARYTNKNKRGAFSITVTTGQILKI